METAMIPTVTVAIFAVQLGIDVLEARPAAEPVQYRRPVRCGHGADLDIRDGRCYPTGTVPPQYQQGARYGYRYDGGGRRAVRCGHGADLDIRDGRCYPTGSVPPQFQNRGGYSRYDDDNDRPRYY
jgi:hypothetical protein